MAEIEQDVAVMPASVRIALDNGDPFVAITLTDEEGTTLTIGFSHPDARELATQLFEEASRG